MSDIPKNQNFVANCKVFLPEAAGSGNDAQVIGRPFLGESNSVCSQTYMTIGCTDENHFFNEEECKNIISYMTTKFFRYLVSLIKKTQHSPKMVYQCVPMQDFSKPWTDEELYAKYNLTDEEIAFIDSMIKPMDGGDE